MVRRARSVSSRWLLPAALSAALLAAPRADANVGVTQGFIAGNVVFDSDFLPDSIDVDAGDTASHQFQSHGSATLVSQQSPSPGRIVSTWSYNLPVEAAQVNQYELRPVARIAALSERIPFPDSSPINVSPGNTSNFDYPYRPVIMKGLAAVADMQSVALPMRSMLVSAFDVTGAATEVVQPDCVGSIAFCVSSSQIWAAVPGSYELYLKPGHQYQLNPQAASVNEDPITYGSQAYTAIEFNDGEPLTAPAAAANFSDPTPTITKDYLLIEQAEITGQLDLSVPNGYTVYAKGVTISGTSLLGLDYVDEFFPSPWNPTAVYISRLFDLLDFTKTITLKPTFFLSANQRARLDFPAQTISVNPGDQKVINFSGAAGILQGRFTFNPPYQVKNSYPGVQVVTAALGSTTNDFVPDAVNGGSYQLLAYADTWSYWSFGWDFNMGDPAFDSTYMMLVSPLANVPVAGLGDVETQNFDFNVDLVKVYFTAPDATGLSDPQLNAVAGYESAHGAAFGQTNVAIGESRVVLRVPSTPTTFQITPSATIHGALVNFSPISLTPEPGKTYVIGTPGNIILSVTSPQPNQASNTCQWDVTGTAGGIQISSITVDGQSVPFTACPSASDPLQVCFQYPDTNTKGSITVTATGQNGDQTYSVSDVIPVQCSNQPPQITSCPAPVATQCGSYAGGAQTLVAGVTDPDGDPLTVTWTVDGATAATDSLQSGATTDAFTYTYAIGAHQVLVTVSDGNGATATCSTTVTVLDTSSPKVTATVQSGMLWPPNHDLVNVGLAVYESDTCDPSPHLGVLVYSNEDDEEETGTGNFSPDAKDERPGSLRLRSERKGNGNGRVYLVIAAGTNASGDVGYDCTSVVVPHDRSSASISAVNTMAANAVATCRNTGAAPNGWYLVGDGPVIGPKQ